MRSSADKLFTPRGHSARLIGAAVLAGAFGCSSQTPVRPGALDASGFDDIRFPDALPAGDVPVPPDAGMADVPMAQFSVGPGTDVATYAQRYAMGFQAGFFDGQMGALMDGSRWSFYGSAFSNSGCSGSPNVQGAFRLGGIPNALSDAYGCTALITDDTSGPGFVSNSPVGRFDRDYVGGGPVARITNPSTGVRGVVLLYHARFEWGPICNVLPCFYSSFGLAFSSDGGMTFTRLGEVIQPYASRPQTLSSTSTLDVGSGTLVLGDINGYPVPNPTGASQANTYFYVFYTDRDPSEGCTGLCLAVARARVLDVANAAFTDNTAALPTLFHKYWRGSWTQPAVSGDVNDASNSGHFSPVLGEPVVAPAVIYDSAINHFLMAHVFGTDIVLRTAVNLFSWSEIIPGAAIHEAGNVLVYPSLVGETGDPSIAGLSPWLFYVAAPAADFQWTEAVFRNHLLQISP